MKYATSVARRSRKPNTLVALALAAAALAGTPAMAGPSSFSTILLCNSHIETAASLQNKLNAYTGPTQLIEAVAISIPGGDSPFIEVAAKDVGGTCSHRFGFSTDMGIYFMPEPLETLDASCDYPDPNAILMATVFQNWHINTIFAAFPTPFPDVPCGNGVPPNWVEPTCYYTARVKYDPGQVVLTICREMALKEPFPPDARTIGPLQIDPEQWGLELAH